MPNVAINNITAPDNYTQQSTIDPGRKIDYLTLIVANQGIFFTLKEYTPPQEARAGYDTAEVYMPPGSRTIDRDTLCGIKVRAAIAAGSLPAGSSQAVVTVEAVLG